MGLWKFMFPKNIMNEKRKSVLEILKNQAKENNNKIFSFKESLKNPNAKIDKNLSNQDLVLSLYKDILNMDIDKTDDGFNYWMKELDKGAPKEQVEKYFRDVAVKHNAEQGQDNKFENLLSPDDVGKRILYVIPESIGDVFISTSLFKNIKETYPEYNLYVATKQEYFEILEGNPYVHKVIPYVPEMDNLFWLEGIDKHKGFFEVAFLPYIGTQRMIDYTHNGKDRIQLDLCT